MKIQRVTLTLVASLSATLLYANPVIEQLQENYRNSGVTAFNSADGKALWYSKQKGRSCTSCHGTSPNDVGQHKKTGKTILPMAPSINPERLTQAAKIEKWFLRNCKWTLDRECSVQEKGDVLQWLKTL